MKLSYKPIIFNLLLILLVCFVSYLVYLYRTGNLITNSASIESSIALDADTSPDIGDKTKTVVKIKGKEFIVDVADTPTKRTIGLMNVAKMDRNKGMLFVFESKGAHAFWMKDTLISLDMIWIENNPDKASRSKKIVHIANDVSPCKNDSLCPLIFPKNKADYVLELNAGIAKEMNLKVGDLVEF